MLEELQGFLTTACVQKAVGVGEPGAGARAGAGDSCSARALAQLSEPRRLTP